MAVRAVQKYPASHWIRDKASAAGIGVVDGDLYVHDGSTPVRKIMRGGNVELDTVGASGTIKIARGQATTASAVDTVAAGLTTVVAVIASADDDPIDGFAFVSASIGDQAGSPAAGSIYIKSWKFTNAATDVTPIAATSFTKKVNWIAFGT